MIKAIVTGAFMCPEGTMLIDSKGELRPSRKLLRPAAKGDKPVRVSVEPWVFTRQHQLGNLQSMDEFDIRAEAQAEIEKLQANVEAAAAGARDAAVHGSERASITADLHGLDDMDKDALVELARRRQLRVNIRRNDANLRKEIGVELQKLIESAE